MAHRTAERRIRVPVAHSAWRWMAFAHWRVEPGAVQALLPRGLEVDTYDGAAWLSLTPFELADVRPGLPGLHGVDRGWSTLETNLRTYVRRPGGPDGLWFLSLDVENVLAVAGARLGVGAPYFRADLTLRREAGTVAYSGRRIGSDADYAIVLRPGEPIEPDPLEVWLTSRWRAYTRHLGRLWMLPVEHEPWPLRAAEVLELRETVTDAAGFEALGAPDLVHWSEGVRRVRSGAPRPCA